MATTLQKSEPDMIKEPSAGILGLGGSRVFKASCRTLRTWGFRVEGLSCFQSFRQLLDVIKGFRISHLSLVFLIYGAGWFVFGGYGPSDQNCKGTFKLLLHSSCPG